MRLDEFPGDLARVHAHEHAARDERRVLRADLTVDQALQRLARQRGIVEAGQRVQVPLLFLGGRGGPEASQELVVARGVARVRQHRDERRQHIGIDGAGIGHMRTVELGRARLDTRVVAEYADRAYEIATQLPRELVLAGAGCPAERGEGGHRAIAHEGLEPSPIARLHHAVERVERRREHRPHVAVALAAEARGQVEVRRERHEARDRERPRVVDQVEALDGRQRLQSLEQRVEQIGGIPHAVKAVAAGVDDDRLRAGARAQPRLALAQQHALLDGLAAGVHAQLHGHLPRLLGLGGGGR